MSFTWTATIGVNNLSTVTAINEIRSNTDWLKDNMNYCASHNATVQATHYDTYQTTLYSGRQASYQSSYCGSNYASAQYDTYSTHQGGMCDECITYNSGNYSWG